MLVFREPGLATQLRAVVEPTFRDDLGDVVIADVLSGVVGRVEVEEIECGQAPDKLESIALVGAAVTPS